jgi:predicted methyltransferase
MTPVRGPLLTLAVHQALIAARDAGIAEIQASFDLGRSHTPARIEAQRWHCQGQAYDYSAVCKDRTVYHWTGEDWAPVSRYAGSLIKLVPTDWGAPTFEIDGIKMLPTAQVSPYADAQRRWR